ncbi:hypothetical protein K438DRAFT_1862804 [Mycena galopus ATCC 62051]|nr:hypothetical protein K438DRAFT_1862804 [Mycena galopus ATCC 62051]
MVSVTIARLVLASLPDTLPGLPRAFLFASARTYPPLLHAPALTSTAGPPLTPATPAVAVTTPSPPTATHAPYHIVLPKSNPSTEPYLSIS